MNSDRLAEHAGRMCTRLFLVSVLLLLLSGCRFLRASTGKAGDAALEEKWGVEVVAIRQSAGGRMLDFRYRVTDPEKAKPLLDRSAKAYLIDRETGVKLDVPNAPKIGSLRQSARQPIAGRVYFVLFSNQNRMVRRGSRVNVVIGDFRADNLIVE